jgi:hypothetical protein
VNRFWKDEKFIKEDFHVSSKEKTEQRWTDEYLEPIFNQIDSYLQNEDDVLILQEVPNMFFDNDSKRFKGICSARIKLKNHCDSKKIVMLFPVYARFSYARTAVLFNKGQYIYDENYKNNIVSAFPKYRNKIVAVHPAIDPDFRVVGMHIPAGCSKFYDSLIALHRDMTEDIPTVYIGDLNTYHSETVNKRKLTEFMGEGLKDFWLESGHKHDAEDYPDATTYVHNGINERLDYALVTVKGIDKLNNKYEMTVDHSVRINGLSDHSAIILKEKTPETKKTGEL